MWKIKIGFLFTNLPLQRNEFGMHLEPSQRNSSSLQTGFEEKMKKENYN